MSTICYNGVGISAMAACVPRREISNRSLADFLPSEAVDKIIDSVGIERRRVCDPDVQASDLCYKAACQLFDENNIEPESIDMLLFMSQVPDFRIPATSCILQHRLGLTQDCAAMDLSLACSGYVYALSCAMAYTSLPGINRVLLLDGEALTKIVNPRDKVNAPLYGDAGTATLVEKNTCFGRSTFMLHTDGSGQDAVKVPAGMRNPITAESLQVTEREEGNLRSDIQIYMDGMEVFNFALRVVPRGIKEILNVTGQQLSDIDRIVFHQSNRFMTDFFVRKLKADPERVPYSIDRFGNTSSASIPLTIVTELSDCRSGLENVILCGFGAGLSWGTALLSLANCNISQLTEY